MTPLSTTLALLPFENLSGLPDDAVLARGFLQDLSSELARFPSLGVIAAESVTACSAKATRGVEIARRVGADHLLTGSLRRVAGTLRISVQLIGASNGRHLWAGRYDEKSLPEMSDEVAARLASALAIQLDQSLLSGARRRQPTSLAAYECWLRGMDCLQRGTPEGDEEGRVFFEHALEVDPAYARGYAGISLSHFNDWSCQAWQSWGKNEQLAYDYAVKADQLDSDDAAVQMILCRIEQYRREFHRAAPRLERALRLAPSDSRLLIQAAGCLAFHGEPERSLGLALRAIELNPLCPGWYYGYAAMPLFLLRRYEEALDMASRGADLVVVDAPAWQAATCAYLGQMELAANYLSAFQREFGQRIAQGRSADAGEVQRWLLHVNPFRRPEDAELLFDGLRLAGMALPPKGAQSVGPLPWTIGNVFRLEGDLWTIAFDDCAVRLPDLRGLHDLRRLLLEPGQEIASTELAGVQLHSPGLDQADPIALKAYRTRLGELDREIEDAADSSTESKVLALEAEREAILREVGRVAGIGGRLRKSNDAGERARSSVTWRIRLAIRKIAALHPSLGKHLRNSIRTGFFCSYQPEQAVAWKG